MPNIPSKKGKQKGIITVNGQISTLIPYRPADVVAASDKGTINAVSGVSVDSLARVMGVPKLGSLGAPQKIDAVMGVDVD